MDHLNAGLVIRCLHCLQTDYRSGILFSFEHWTKMVAIENGPFGKGTALDHSNNGLVQYVDPHCIRFSVMRFE